MSKHLGQLALNFELPTDELVLHLRLSGLTVRAEVVTKNTLPSSPADVETLRYHLDAINLDSDLIRDTHGLEVALSFPTHQLIKLHDLPEYIQITTDQDLEPIWHLTYTTPTSEVAKVTDLQGGSLTLTIPADAGHSERVYKISPTTALALLHSKLPFSADDASWSSMRKLNVSLPVILARARLTPKNTIEISASVPSLVESSPIRALYRKSLSKYGVPGRMAEDVTSIPGLVWDGPAAPILSKAHLTPDVKKLSSHHQADLALFVGALTTFGPQALVWSSGLGRRVMALAALESLEAFPAIIICHPSQVWAWTRHLAIFSRTVSLRHSRSDIRIVTYRDLPRLAQSLPTPAAVIADSFMGADVSTPAVRQAIRSLTAGVDSISIGLDSSLAKTATGLVAAMSMIRPGEFNPDELIQDVYPNPSEDRAKQHAMAYIFTRGADAALATAPVDFPRAKVLQLTLPPSLEQELKLALYDQTLSPTQRLINGSVILSSGSKFNLSPRISAAAALIREHAASGRRVVVLTRDPRSAELIASIAKPADTVILDLRILTGGAASISGTADLTKGSIFQDAAVKATGQAAISATGGAQSLILIVDAFIPPLETFDVVVIAERIWAAEVIDAALAPASGNSKQLAIEIHFPNTIEDRFALLSLAAAEVGASSRSEVRLTPTEQEITAILTPRE